MLEWIQKPESVRPSWISVYFDEPDHAAHTFGPNATEVGFYIIDLLSKYFLRFVMVTLQLSNTHIQIFGMRS